MSRSDVDLLEDLLPPAVQRTNVSGIVPIHHLIPVDHRLCWALRIQSLEHNGLLALIGMTFGGWRPIQTLIGREPGGLCYG